MNIEETTNCATPIIIGELYGGGNMAGYSVYGYNSDGTLKDKATFDAENEGKTDAEKAVRYKDPQLNVRSFTSIGAIFGGGYSAEMVADPTVNINVVKGSRNTTEIGENQSTPSAAPFHNLPYPAHASGAIGSIGNVFGGGNLAKVYGSATVNVGTEEKAYFIMEPIHLRTNPSTPMTPVASGDYAGLYEVTVEGANITGNVYGGGNLADVTGNTQVNICAKKSGNDYIAVAEGVSKVTIGGNVFGGENLINNIMALAPWTKYLLPVPFYFLEILIGVVQALVFTLLVAVYIGSICNHGDEETTEGTLKV